jgi:predicted  nucleic acid-binding Zn-ribbon protein
MWRGVLSSPITGQKHECPFCGEILNRKQVLTLIEESAHSCPKCHDNRFAFSRKTPNRTLAELDEFSDEDTEMDFVPPIAQYFDKHQYVHEELINVKRRKHI